MPTGGRGLSVITTKLYHSSNVNASFFENFFDIFKKILRIYRIALYERDKIMKFKTIVITKKKLIIAVLGILFLGGIITTVSLIPPKTANVFNYQNEIYEDILAEGLPNNNEKTSA